METNETTAHVAAHGEPTQDEVEDRMMRIIVRQQDLIVQQAETITRAMSALVGQPTPATSLRAELDAFFGAIRSITPEDLQQAANIARAALKMLQNACAVGGGAVRGTS
jgi:hypothetical protein